MRVVYAVRTAVVLPLFVAFTLLAAAYLFAFVSFRGESGHVDTIISSWARTFVIVFSISYDVTGADRVDTSRPVIYVSNHRSNADIPVHFLTLPGNLRYLAKKELFRVPIFGATIRKIGIVEIDRRAGAAVMALIDSGVEQAVARGHSIMVYPEGSRSTGNALRPFKKGAFHLAVAHDLDVVPVTIVGTGEIWPPHSKIMRPGSAHVTVHEPIRTSEMSQKDVPELTARARSIIEDTFLANTQS